MYLFKILAQFSKFNETNGKNLIPITNQSFKCPIKADSICQLCNNVIRLRNAVKL